MLRGRRNTRQNSSEGETRIEGEPKQADLTRIQDEILRKIQERWREYYPWRSAALMPRVTGIGGPEIRRFSILYEYEIAFPGSRHPEVPIIAKIRRDQRASTYDEVRGSSRAKRNETLEFDVLSRAFHFFCSNEDGLRVVRPIDFLSLENATLIEKASGFDLGILIREGRRPLTDLFTLSGKWLRYFHSGVHPLSKRPWPVDEYQRRLEKRRESLIANGVPCWKLDALIEPILSGVHQNSGESTPHSLLHGDYKLRHIWADSKGIQVIDFGNVHEGDCYEDVASLIVELMVLSWAKPWFDRSDQNAWAEAFLAGYFGGEDVPRVLRFYVLDALFKKWNRRLIKWTGHAITSKIQNLLNRLGVGHWVDRAYLDRWFITRIREQF